MVQRGLYPVYFVCGEIESIQTGQKWQFADLDSLCDFLQAQVLPGPAEQPAREDN